MTYRMIRTFTYPEGDSRQTVTIHPGTAAEAHAARLARLRDCHKPHRSGPGWIEFTDPHAGGWVGGEYEPSFEVATRLEYVDIPERGAR